MKADEIREMTNEELQQRLADLKTELFNLRFQLAIGQLDNSARVKNVRKDLARVKTIIHERKLKIRA